MKVGVTLLIEKLLDLLGKTGDCLTSGNVGHFLEVTDLVCFIHR